jgi:eukaryotic-like serine/threonine-protein kinase
MDRERWRQVDRISASALRRRPDERAAFLDEECDGDEELRMDVDSIIAHGQAEDFMERPVAEEAARLVAKVADEPLDGQTVGPYKILRRLGAGGMGEIYLARDARLARPVALKLLSAHFTADEEHVRRFRREALAASALNHPNILTVYEVGRWRGRDFIAAEYVEGVTLRALMRGKKLSLPEALDTALQIAAALSAAHGAGIVHRDIKPENVMIRPDGLVKVLDFGIAKYAEPPAHARDSKQSWVMTATGVVIGTTAYMSPEQTRGVGVDARSDVWSLGVILYEMVARRLPFPGKTPTDRVAAILEREPEPLSRLRRGVPPELERIVGRTLAKNRDERYTRVAEMAEDLRRLRATLGDERPFRFTMPAPARGLLLYGRRRVVVRLAVLLLVMTAALAAGIYFLRPGAGGAQITSLAVLPLANAGGSADAEYLSDGITESLIDSLSQLPNLKVMSRNSVFRYKGQEVDARTVGNTLGVSAVLMGRLVQRGDDLTVSVELVDAGDNSHLWGGQYSRKMADLLALQSEVTRDVSRKLRARLSSPDEQRLAKSYTGNPEAYQLYLKGRYHLLKNTRPEIQTGVSYFRQAIEVDPSYALAHAGLAEAYRLLAISGEMPPTELMPQAKAAARKAVEIDDGLAEAHTALGHVIFWHDWDWEAAENQFRRALELDPNSADAHGAYANLLSYTGRHDEAIAEIKRARELDPLNPRTNVIEGVTLINAGRADEALDTLRKTLKLEPNYWFARQYAASAYIEKGMYPEAIAEAREAREFPDVPTRPAAFLGYALAKSGRRAEARAEVEGLLKLSKERYVPPYNIAMIYNGLGKRDETLAWLERGYREREPRMVFLKVEPKWNNLRDDPRFQDLLRRVGFTP